MRDQTGKFRTLMLHGYERTCKNTNVGISTPICIWILDFLTNRPHGCRLSIYYLFRDDPIKTYYINLKADGQTLLSEMFRRINLIESDYFGLEFQNLQMNWVWLDPTKLMVKQVRRPMNSLFRLSVKFFPPDPGQLQEEFTRYLFSLQIKRDLTDRRLNCTENTAALLVSHLVQSDIGDYDDIADREFLKTNKLLPYQDRVQEKIMELHRRNTGETPAESDFKVLEIARKLEMYGVRFHPAADREGTKINLSVAHMGLQVFQGNTKINTFNWSKIRKLSFKRKRFLIKLHPEVHGPHQDTLEFLMASRDQCKIFWKNCVEHHSFFRLLDQPQPKSKAIFFNRGSSFRYSGRTQKQLVEYVRDSGLKRTPYQRRNSNICMSAHSLASDVLKQNLSFNDSFRAPESSATASFHSLHSPMLTETPNQLQHFQQTQQPARAPSLMKDSIRANSHSTYAFPGATHIQAAGDCSPLFVCVESSSFSAQQSQNGNEDSMQVGEVDLCGVGYGVKKGFLTPEAFEAELMHSRHMSYKIPMLCTQLHVSEEYIDDDPAEMSFYAGGAEAYCYGFDEAKADKFEISHENPVQITTSALSLEDLNCHSNAFSESGFGRSETSSLVNNRSACSSLDNLPLCSASDSFSLGFGGPDSSSSLRLPGSENLSEASSMVNFPAYSVRSEDSSAMQFNDLVEQLEQLSYPPTATEGSANDSAIDSPQLPHFNAKGSLCLSPSFQMSTLSLPGQAPSPLQSPILNEVAAARLEEEEEGRRKKYPSDKAYFIAKEILTTERTFLKDLEVITVWFRSAVIKENVMPEGLMNLLFSNIDPIYEFHRGFLKEIDQRLALWEGRRNAHVKGDCQRIGDVMLCHMCALKKFTGYLQKHNEVLTELEKATKCVKKLEIVYKEFELQKVCYLPLNTFLLKPIQRLMHYKLILERLCNHYTPQHTDYKDCKEALKEVAGIATPLQSSLIRLENFQKLTELQRDLIGIEKLTAPGREFIREGCLYKLTKKGLQQRMFFLFSDMLLYTSKGVTATNQFKVHGQLPLYGMIVEESENDWFVPHCFTIYSAQRTIVVAASSKLEMNKWIEDLNKAIDMSKKTQEKSDLLLDPSLCDHPNRLLDEVSLEHESEDDMNSSRCSMDKQSHHRANTIMHVCWHRNTSVSVSDHSLAVENQLSGYLLRKFKNSNGWQKLWVVFTNFCLFFYKTHQDDFPLASLPLLGYTVSIPGESDSIYKEYVFKLQFKSHVYFFRAESEYIFDRWMEVIKSATNSTGRMSRLVPKDPEEMNGGT
ncbi:FERM, ARHGEF and pleckstrin domain-containing protein 2 FERM domain-including [Triplophysa tibetana]|uniref:FERM, ARHGEF and pleckstrin domain-containing protein 2 n=1 Tax=Triplophysa tibetana TaxID=1572043 RepID=A0A5A9NU88_9TELE|nr:FERM, ARHGEF and pleckstrin domain-containing protein 2 FERM domain-including [Triplophysa tibetana]